MTRVRPLCVKMAPICTNRLKVKVRLGLGLGLGLWFVSSLCR